MDKAATDRPTAPKASHRDLRRAIWVSLLIALILALALFYEQHWWPHFPRRDQPYTVGDPQGALRTGSVVIVPPKGNVCRQRVIDNYTWVIRDAGVVNCDEIGPRGEAARDGVSTPRLDAIRDSFSRKK